jgi:hypothetical protein
MKCHSRMIVQVIDGCMKWKQRMNIEDQPKTAHIAKQLDQQLHILIAVVSLL